MQATLSDFITNLLEKGEITVSNHLTPFSDMDLLDATNALRQMYERDALDMPFSVPEFTESSAIWAATYLYRAVQCSLMRDIDEAQVKGLLLSFPNEKNASIIYSADLMLRYLPDLWNLAKGLAPDDILVILLRQIAHEFPFSSIGIPLEGNADLDIILAQNSLKLAYIDRIILAKDFNRINDERLIILAKEILGNQANILAPEMKEILAI